MTQQHIPTGLTPFLFACPFPEHSDLASIIRRNWREADIVQLMESAGAELLVLRPFATLLHALLVFYDKSVGITIDITRRDDWMVDVNEFINELNALTAVEQVRDSENPIKPEELITSFSKLMSEFRSPPETTLLEQICSDKRLLQFSRSFFSIARHFRLSKEASIAEMEEALREDLET